MKLLTIGQLATQARVNVQTIRYYERCGLLTAPARLESGYRIYSPDVIRRIRFIKQAQKLGFTLYEIADLLALSVQSEDVCDDVRQRADAKIQELDAKMGLLLAMRQVLQQLVTDCSQRQLTTICPLLDALQTQLGENQ